MGVRAVAVKEEEKITQFKVLFLAARLNCQKRKYSKAVTLISFVFPSNAAFMAISTGHE